MVESTIKIETDEYELELTIDEAKKLYNELDELFGKKKDDSIKIGHNPYKKTSDWDFDWVKWDVVW